MCRHVCVAEDSVCVLLFDDTLMCAVDVRELFITVHHNYLNQVL